MKFLKLFALLTLFLLLPATIFASKNKTQPCETGFKRNNIGLCEELKAPERGKLNSYKDDFECERGYTKNTKNWSCDEIKLPENGVLTVAGNDWTCISNYKRVGDGCVKVTLPENAKFFIHGSDWFCNSGYQKQNDKCVRLEIPTNAYQTYSGNDWECKKGFKESEDTKSCEEVKIPTNATSNYIGSFNCSSGYKKEGDECKKQPEIDNGKFYTQGSQFYCNNGYKRNESERKCEKIKIPENAREDNLGLDGWTCHKEFIKEGSECKKFYLPDNAEWSANIWKCKPGYRKNPSNKSCDKLNLPENAHYTDTHDGWLCNDGFTKNYKEHHCDKV